MADNVIANAGSGGSTFATDDIGGVHYPINKIAIGALDSQTLLTGGNGTTDAGTVRVTVSSDSTGVLSIDDNGASITVDAAALDIRALTNADVITAELSAVDNAVLDAIESNTDYETSSIFRSLDLDESEEEVKGTAGFIHEIFAVNLSAAILFLKVYSAPASSVIVGTTTPVLTLPIPTNGDANGTGFTWPKTPTRINVGGTGISVAVTTGLADADTGAPGTNKAVVNILYS